MRKSISTIGFILLALNCFSQKNFTAGASLNFNFAAKGLSTNDAGFGITLHSNFFSNNKIRLRTEASIDHFIGSKLLVTDAIGNAYTSNPTIYSVKAGPEIYPAENVSFAALYGFATYELYDAKVRSGNLKLLLNTHLGDRKKAILGLYFSGLREGGRGVNFFGILAGYRFL